MMINPMLPNMRPEFRMAIGNVKTEKEKIIKELHFHSVWTFCDFSITQILREINMGILEVQNLSFFYTSEF